MTGQCDDGSIWLGYDDNGACFDVALPDMIAPLPKPSATTLDEKIASLPKDMQDEIASGAAKLIEQERKRQTRIDRAAAIRAEAAVSALESSPPDRKDHDMTEAQIKHMVDRFLQWRLPKDFNPDGGISYQRPNYAPEVDATPSGTNLLDAAQATDMVRFMVDGLPAPPVGDR
jgi:hypothetical protein